MKWNKFDFVFSKLRFQGVHLVKESLKMPKRIVFGHFSAIFLTQTDQQTSKRLNRSISSIFEINNWFWKIPGYPGSNNFKKTPKISLK